MLILTIRTDKPEAELGLFEDGKQLAEEKWQAHRQLAETIHTKITKLLAVKGQTLEDIAGIVGYEGPGSFTGLRIGLTVANTLADSLQVPIVGTTGDAWHADGVAKLQAGHNDRIVLPDYGAPAHVTQQIR